MLNFLFSDLGIMVISVLIYSCVILNTISKLSSFEGIYTLVMWFSVVGLLSTVTQIYLVFAYVESTLTLSMSYLLVLAQIFTFGSSFLFFIGTTSIDATLKLLKNRRT